jgi:transcriptional regulator with XRE-family HTH domain
MHDSGTAKQFSFYPGINNAIEEAMKKTASAVLKIRHREFGAFLRSRRERLDPAGVGLPFGFRRRTPGLRREEVAMLAGVGTTWYTWLEQGRDVRPSAEVLSALADALRLDAAERRHIYVLNDRSPPEGPQPAGPERVDAPLQRMLESLDRQPAYILGRRWDVLAWNRAASIVFGDYSKLEGDERNVMHMVFANEDHRRLLVDWDQIAPASLAMFRADSARYAGDPEFERLIGHLKQASPAFRKWWPKYEVHQPLSGRKRVQHPISGRMVFEYTSLAVGDPANMRFVVFTPVNEERTAAKLSKLLRNGKTDSKRAGGKSRGAPQGRAAAR